MYAGLRDSRRQIRAARNHTHCGLITQWVAGYMQPTDVELFSLCLSAALRFNATIDLDYASDDWSALAIPKAEIAAGFAAATDDMFTDAHQHRLAKLFDKMAQEYRDYLSWLTGR